MNATITGMSAKPIIISFRGSDVPVTFPNISKEIAEKAIRSSMFQRWIKRSERIVDKSTISLRGVEIQTVDMFGPRKVGFIKVKADAYLVANGTEIPKALPGISLLRGDAVGILMVLRCSGKKYTILVQQPRVPVGDVSCLEIPAGMIDKDDSTIKGIAIAEIEEECGIKVVKSDLVKLTNKMAIMPSPGGCDESVDLYYVDKEVGKSEFDGMQGRVTGNREDGEFIKLKIVPFDEAWKLSGDAKLLCAIFLYQKIVEEKNEKDSAATSNPVKRSKIEDSLK